MKPDPRVEAAVDFLGRVLYDRVFFEKLAAYGYAPRNDMERYQLTTLAYILRKGTSPLLGENDVAPDDFTKTAAQVLVRDKTIKKAAKIILENM